MKFIQLLSTIAALAIFATAPGVSAAGLRAGGDKTEEASGRRSLYVKYAGPQGELVGPINTPGFGGMGIGPRVDFNDNSESQYYNNPGRAHAYGYAYDNKEEGYGGGGGQNCQKKTDSFSCSRSMPCVWVELTADDSGSKYCLSLIHI